MNKKYEMNIQMNRNLHPVLKNTCEFNGLAHRNNSVGKNSDKWRLYRCQKCNGNFPHNGSCPSTYKTNHLKPFV